jgi:small subunit ribosomal protein S6
MFRVSGTDQELAKSAMRLEEPIKKAGGSMQQTQALGRRKLAFRIGRQTEGYYHLFRFQAPTQRVAELERWLRLEDGILRFLIVAAEEDGSPTSPPHSRGEDQGSRAALVGQR